MAYNKFVSSLIKGLLILECFNPNSLAYSLAEITKKTGISKATAFRLLKTLSELNYLRYEPENKKYYLGSKVLSLGFSVLQGLEIREICRPYLEKLSRESNKTANLAIVDKLEMVYIDRIRYPDIQDLNITVGSRIPIYNTSVGRAVLAYQNREGLDEIIKQLIRDNEAVRYIGKDGEYLRRVLDEVRRNGFATNDPERQKEANIHAIAVPIRTPTGVTCAINIVVGSHMSIQELKNKYSQKLIKISNEISEVMGYRFTG